MMICITSKNSDQLGSCAYQFRTKKRKEEREKTPASSLVGEWRQPDKHGRENK
jgi:hypothetical protein